MEIVPAILTDKEQTFVDMFTRAEKYANMVQIDIMDGEFVSSKSITRQDLKGKKSSGFTEAHLMVQDPLEWIEPFKEFGAGRIIFHYEINKDKEPVIEAIKSKGLSAGMAVNPYTEIKDFLHLVKSLDMILFMSVVPGFYGAKFIPSVLTKIREFKELFPDKPIGIDGGVKLENLKEIASCGINFICVGSAILKSDNPASKYKEFTESLK
jgi:ribulose-phosphate 3-epimerase